MSRSSSSRERRERGLAEPTVALAAVLALSFGLSAYALVLDGVAVAGEPAASPTLERVDQRVTAGGVVDPERVPALDADALGDGSAINVTLSVAGRRWSAGPTPPTHRTTATRRVGVIFAPGRVRPGRLSVRAWR